MTSNFVDKLMVFLFFNKNYSKLIDLNPSVILAYGSFLST